MENSVVIVSAKRTAIGKFMGSLAAIPATRLAAATLKDHLALLPDASQVDEVILGHVLQSGTGQNPARQAALLAGVPPESGAFTVGKVCASAMKAVILGAQSILVGDNQCCLAGGMENMSAAPYLLPKARQGYRMGNGQLIDSMVNDGLWCAMNDYHMGITAENVARQYGLTRSELDAFALGSQQKAAAAIARGDFTAEITPLDVRKGKETISFCNDEFVRADATLEQLAKLKPAFSPEGVVTAGNASGINDAAATLMLMNAAKAKSLGLTPLARIRSWASAGVDPAVMGLGPVPASRLALKRAGLAMTDIDLFEANEAFAAQSLAVMRDLQMPADKTNISGGAIALGHPIGASGARILVTLLHALQRCDKTLGLATLCIGGGQGCALIVERL